MTDNTPGFREELEETLSGLSAPERRATFLGLIGRRFPDEEQPILVGGALVELLTEGQYVTGDLDLIENASDLKALLEQAGFEKTGRHYVHDELGLTVETVGTALDPERRSERIEWKGYTVRILSIEDLIVDRLCAAKFRDSTTDHEQADLVYTTHHDRLNLDRLEARAQEEQVHDLLHTLGDGHQTKA